jgi:hypothetical protein
VIAKKRLPNLASMQKDKTNLFSSLLNVYRGRIDPEKWSLVQKPPQLLKISQLHRIMLRWLPQEYGRPLLRVQGENPCNRIRND